MTQGNAMSQMMNKAICICSTYHWKDLLCQGYEKTVGESRRFAKLWIEEDHQPEVCLSAPERNGLKGHIRLLYVVHRPLDNGGGTELFTKHLAEEMARRGHCVTVLAHSDERRRDYSHRTGNVLWRERQEGAIRVIEYRHAKPPCGVLTDVLFDDPDICGFGKELLRTIEPDFVHITHLRAGAAVAKACIEMHVPYGMTMTDFFCVCRYSTLIDRHGRCCRKRDCETRCGISACRVQARELAVKRMMEHACFVAAPSGYVASRLFAEYGKRCYRIAHDVNVPSSYRREERVASRRLLYVGKLAPLKGLHLFLQAAIQVKQPFSLTICGRGNRLYEKKLKRIVKGDPRVRFAGAVPHDEIWRAYAEADAVVIPSLCPETYCLAAHEAIAAGCRIMAVPNGALREAIRESDGVSLHSFSVDCIEAGLEELDKKTAAPQRRTQTPECDGYGALYADAVTT